MPSELIPRFEKHLEESRLLRTSGPLVVACSGGSDSVALLRLLDRLAPAFGWTLVVFHASHGLRKEEGVLDARFVADLAAALRLPLAFRTFETSELRRGGESLEAAARRLRYDALLGLREDLGAGARVVTGHTRDDQAETVLLNLSRHSGRNRGGIRELRPDGVARPLLRFLRGELRAFLNSEGQGWREDQSNADLRFARNRIRHRTLPDLERKWPGVTVRLARAGDEWTRRLDLLDETVDRLVEKSGCQAEGPWPRKLLRELPPDLLGRLFLRAVGARGRVPGNRQLEAAIWKSKSARSCFREQIGGLVLTANDRVVSLAITGRLIE